MENPNDVAEGGHFSDNINPESLSLNTSARVEPSLADIEPGTQIQFERLGYFVADSEDSKAGALVFNRTIALRDSWAKLEKKLAKAKGKN